MKQGRDDAERWLKQAEHNLKVAESNLSSGFFSDACYMCEQACQVALKSMLIYRSARPARPVHSIQKLAEECSKFSDKFKMAIDEGKILDRYYIPTRYPDALATPSVPYEIYTQQDAQGALDIARKILSLVRAELDRTS